MKKTVLFQLVILLFLGFSCVKPNEEEICDCFVKQTTTNIEDLIGRWEFESFGYTVDGEKIKEKEKIARGGITFSEDGKFSLSYVNTMWGNYSISRINAIKFFGDVTTKVGMTKKEEEKENAIFNCIDNSTCFLLLNEKLYIHSSKVKNFNLLILTKKI